jgi:hypothetical protein
MLHHQSHPINIRICGSFDGATHSDALERKDWSNDAALAYYKSTNLLKKYKRYSNDFIQKESIFERLWLYRFSNLMLHEGPQPDPQCDQ